MSIPIEDVLAGRVDFSDIVDPDGERLGPIHPGEILHEDFMKPMRLSPHALAKGLRVPLARVRAIIHGRRAITVGTALRLGRYFGTSSDLWLGLQGDHDLEIAERDLAARIEAEVEPRPMELDDAA